MYYVVLFLRGNEIHNSTAHLSGLTVVTSIRNVPGSKWRLLSNILACVGKTSETVANWNN